ncbi:TPA: hypothetical protein N6325_001941 [Escherichia coli]|nr:hypothetical protein [Escherichia coli]
MQERAAVGLTLIETFWNFFRWQKWGKTLQKGQKRGKKGAKKEWIIVAYCCR